MREESEIPAEKLRYICNPEDFGFKDTSSVPAVQGFIGQERAAAAIRFGLEINNPQYNIFVTGHTGKGRKRGVICEYLKNFTKERFVSSGPASLKDLCYVHNFEQPDRPVILILGSGQGKRLKKQMEAVLEGLKEMIPGLLLSQECIESKNEILRACDQKEILLINSFKKQAAKANFTVLPSKDGYVITPLSKKTEPGQELRPMPRHEYAALPESEKNSLDKKQSTLMGKLLGVSGKISDLRKEYSQEIKELERTLAKKCLESVFGNLSEAYADFPKVLDYFNGLKEYVLNNMDMFFQGRNNGEHEHFPASLEMEQVKESFFLPFSVNLFMDNCGKDRAPVVFEGEPTFTNLFGTIEKKFMLGAYLTDHACLRAGSLCRANGGYLVLDASDVLSQNTGVWQKLEKILKHGFLEMEEPFSRFGMGSNLNPEPIPINLKVVMIGDPELYHLLVKHDPDFPALFKVKAELDSEMPLNRDNKESYAGFVAVCCQEENLLPFSPAGVAKIVEAGARLAGSQLRLSAKFDEIKDLAIEASYWASKSQAPLVQPEHVRKALEMQRLRLNLKEEKIQRIIKDGIILIDTQGKKVGQVNGLSVSEFGDYSFGEPSRITAKTFAGDKGLISIQREVKLSGPQHDTGVLTLQNYFSERYGKYRKISFSASLSFEQCYGGVEGDSASAAELFCLISSLSRLPIDQSFAVTGSVNQNGEIQPIGGVNEKIEGFFNVCRERGLTGSQGVIIPLQNISDLMLKEDVVEACKEGKFCVQAIKTVDEGLRLLMKKSADEIDGEVKKHLQGMQEKTFEKTPNQN